MEPRGENDNRSAGTRWANGAVARRALFVTSFAMVLCFLTSVPSASGSSSTSWRDPTLRVVGGPIVEGNAVLVLDVTSKHVLDLSAVSPTNGKVLWSVPYSPSQITLGVAFAPVAIGNIALDLAPSGSLSDPVVQAAGIDIESGKVVWRLKQLLDVTDAPVVCAQGAFFCFPAFSSQNATDLVALNPQTGALVGVLAGPYRNMGTAIPGLPNNSTLWQTDASTETLMQTSPIEKPLWSHTVASLFGSGKYSANEGYDFVATDGLDVGTVGIEPVGKTESLGDAETIGIASNSGVVKWRATGSIYCGGSLQFLLPLVNCKFTGVMSFTSGTANFDRATLVLTGISGSTGKLTWSQPVKDIQSLSTGTGVPFSDTSHVVVETPGGDWKLLDVQNGQLSSILPNSAFWCEEIPSYQVVAIQGEAGSAHRTSEPVYVGCTKTGKVTSETPSTTPLTVGVSDDNVFIWPTPNGLRGRHVN
jgi:outer membrane protein assembly factor BamB